jgi:hypothetical protein
MDRIARGLGDDSSGDWPGKPAPEPRLLFARNPDGSWQPDAYAQGAFRGLHGGAVAGLMCAVAEDEIGRDMMTNAITAHLLHPAALQPLMLRVAVVHRGSRAAICDVFALQNDVMVARATVTSTRGIHVPAAPEEAATPFDPAKLTYLPQYTAPPERPWLLGVCDQASASDGSWWFRLNARITGAESRFARILSSADWTTGVSRKDDWRSPIVRSMPNVELTMHADRSPASEWVGVYAYARWWRRGNAFASAALVDTRGEYGRFSATVLLIP